MIKLIIQKIRNKIDYKNSHIILLNNNNIMSNTRLAFENPHPRDKNLVFDEPTHKYTILYYDTSSNDILYNIIYNII